MRSPTAALRRVRSLFLVATIVLSACTPPGSGATTVTPAPSGGTALFADFTEASILNPIFQPNPKRIARLLFDSLIVPDAKTGSASPSLAEKWDQSPDGLTYTFHIRPNVKWSDGQPFTAEDAKFTFDAIRDPKNASPYRGNFDRIASIDVAEPLTLRVTLKTASCPFLLNAMTMGIVPKHVLGTSADLPKEDFNQNPITGTGPFVFKERQKGDHITLVANPNYWRGKPKFDQWVFKVVPDANVEVIQLKTGEVDYASVQPDAVQELEQAGLDFKSYLGRNYDFLAYNLKRPLFQDTRVRQALTYALDRNQIVQEVLFGQGQVINSPIPVVSWAINTNLPAYDYNLETARQLLAQAGWTPGSDGALRKGGQAFQFTLLTNSGNKVRAADTVIAQAQFKKLGIDVQQNTLELGAFNQKVKTEGDFDAVVFGVTTERDPDQTTNWASTQSGNFNGYSNPAADQLLQQAAIVLGCSQADRTPLYSRFQEVIAADQPYTFLYVRKTLLAVNKRIQGVDPSAWAGDEFNIQNWVVSSR